MLQSFVVRHVVSAVALSAGVFGSSSAVLAQTPSSAVTLAPAPAAALNSGPTNDPLAYYRAYEAALTRGDIEAASTAAVAAWQTGERVWNGNNPNLPGLAYNAAWSLGLANKIAQAQAPARRAVAFAAQSPDKINPKEAAFLLAYADMMVSPTKARVEAFDTAAKALDNGGWSDLLLARAYLDGSRLALNVALPRVSRNLGDRGLVEAARVTPTNDNLRIGFLILRTQSSLQLRDYSQAVREVMDARISYGPPKSQRDLNWAALAAWEAASRAVFESVKGPSMSTGTRINRPDSIPPWDEAEEERLSGKPPECVDIDIKRRGRTGPQGIRFPSQELNDMYAGGAYIRAQLDGDGKVISTDILSSLPRPAFGIAAQQGISNWQYDLPAGTPIQCRTVDISVMYAFMN